MATSRKTSTLINEQLPSFVRDEGPKFEAFIRAYYEWMEQSNNAIDVSKNLMSRAELDTTKRRELYYECQSLVSDDGGSIIPLFNSYVSANSKAIAHNEIAANWDSDGAKCVERWWFA